MNHRSEIDLLSGARQFDKAILTEIYDLYSPGLFAYAFRLMGESAAAEDCVSETFTRFLNALRNGGGPVDHLQAYLYRVAHNWITDRYRREPLAPLELDENFTTQSDDHLENHVAQNIEIHKIHQALRALTPEQRLVITLRFFEGWDTLQVAAATQRPVGAVKALQFRGVAALRRALNMDEVLDE